MAWPIGRLWRICMVGIGVGCALCGVCRRWCTVCMACIGVCGYGVRCYGVGCTYGVRCVYVVWCTLCVRVYVDL